MNVPGKVKCNKDDKAFKHKLQVCSKVHKPIYRVKFMVKDLAKRIGTDFNRADSTRTLLVEIRGAGNLQTKTLLNQYYYISKLKTEYLNTATALEVNY